MIETQKISKIPMSTIKENNSMIVNRYWEKVDPILDKNKIDLKNNIILKIKEAKHSIIICTPIISDYDIIESLKSRKDDCIIVLLLKQYDQKNMLDVGLIRTFNEIKHTCIIFDKITGFWIDKAITENVKPNVFVELKDKTCQTLFKDLRYIFWNNNDTEYLFGKKRKIKPIHESLKSFISNESQKPLKISDLKKSLENEIIEMAVLNKEIFEEFSYYLFGSKKIVLEIHDGLKNQNFQEGTEIFGFTEPINWFYLKTEKSAYISDEFITLPLTENDKINDLLNFNKLYKFVQQNVLSNIQNNIIDDKVSWTSIKKDSPIVDQITKKLDDIKTEKIEDWLDLDKLKQLNKPEIKDEYILARKIEYTWNILPPYLPDGTWKKYRLYNDWENFLKEYDKMLSDIEIDVQKYLDYLESTKIKNNKRKKIQSEIQEIKDKLSKSKQKFDEFNTPINIIEENLDTISLIGDSFNKIIEKYRKELVEKKKREEKKRDNDKEDKDKEDKDKEDKDKEDKDKEDKDKEDNDEEDKDKEDNDEEDKDKEDNDEEDYDEEDEPNELEVSKKDTQNTKKKSSEKKLEISGSYESRFKKLKDYLPRRNLPIIGKIIEMKNQIYLLIEKYEEIRPAIEYKNKVSMDLPIVVNK